MMRILLPIVLLSAIATLPSRPSAAAAVTLHGWFSDEGCAAAKIAAKGDITPNGTACVKKCLDEGATPVFVDPKARAMYQVKNHPSVKEDVGFYVAVGGVIDEQARTISVTSVQRLGEVAQMCSRKPKRGV